MCMAVRMSFIYMQHHDETAKKKNKRKSKARATRAEEEEEEESCAINLTRRVHEAVARIDDVIEQVHKRDKRLQEIAESIMEELAVLRKRQLDLEQANKNSQQAAEYSVQELQYDMNVLRLEQVECGKRLAECKQHMNALEMKQQVDCRGDEGKGGDGTDAAGTGEDKQDSAVKTPPVVDWDSTDDSGPDVPGGEEENDIPPWLQTEKTTATQTYPNQAKEPRDTPERRIQLEAAEWWARKLGAATDTSFLDDWISEFGRKERKALSRLGAVRQAYCQCGVAFVGADGTTYGDVGNYWYARALEKMFPEMSCEIGQLNDASKGDVVEAFLGAAYLVLDEECNDLMQRTTETQRSRLSYSRQNVEAWVVKLRGGR